MKFTFKIPKNDKLYTDGTYLTNGHWLVSKEALEKFGDRALERVFRPVINLSVGHYEFGSKISDTPPDMRQIVPRDLQGRVEAKLTNRVCYNDDTTEISALVLEPAGGGYEVHIAAHYAALLRMVPGARVMVSAPNTPIVVALPDDTIAAVIMPIRCAVKTKSEAA